MKYSAFLAAIVGGLFLPLSAQAQQQKSYDINSLSATYDEQARSVYGENDVKAALYQWFAGFDHQLEAGFFLNRLTAEPIMNYPGTPIKSQDDFLAWYQNVTENIVWNTHVLSEIKVSGDQQTGWTVTYLVNWKARDKAGETYDLFVDQEVEMVRVGELLKIQRLTAEVRP